MLVGFVIVLRESLEAALAIVIVIGVLRRLGRLDQAPAVWLGVFAAALVSFVAGVMLTQLNVAFEGRGKAVFEGLVMLVAAGVLTWVILWMQRQGQQVRSSLEQGTPAGPWHTRATGGSPVALDDEASLESRSRPE